MEKIHIRKEIKIKPRNQVVLAAQQMRGAGAGSHKKSEKSLRLQAKRDLKKIVF
jgi:hypothetical protein